MGVYSHRDLENLRCEEWLGVVIGLQYARPPEIQVYYLWKYKESRLNTGFLSIVVRLSYQGMRSQFYTLVLIMLGETMLELMGLQVLIVVSMHGLYLWHMPVYLVLCRRDLTSLLGYKSCPEKFE